MSASVEDVEFRWKKWTGAPGPFADEEGLRDRLRIGPVHGAGVVREDAAHRGRLRDDRGEFLRGHVDVGHVAHAGGDSERSLGHGVPHQSQHLLEFLAGGLPVLVAHDVGPDRAGADVGRRVDGDAGFVEVVEEPAQGLPLPVQFLGQGALDPAAARAHRRRLPVHLGGEPLERERRPLAAVEQAPKFGVAVHVDEAGGHVETGGVDGAFRAAAGLTDRDDALSLDRQIGDDARRPGPVEDGAAPDHQVVVRRPAAEEPTREDEPRKGKAPGCAVPERHRRLSREGDPGSARRANRAVKVRVFSECSTVRVAGGLRRATPWASPRGRIAAVLRPAQTRGDRHQDHTQERP